MQEVVYHTNFQLEDNYWWFKSRNEILKKTVEYFCNLNKDFNLLDVGCGTGGFAAKLLDKCNVIGIDTSETALDYAKKRGLTNLHNCLLSDFPKEKYSKINAITMLDVIEHIENDYEVVKDAYKLLENDSYFIASVPAYQWLWSRHDEIHMHYRRYSISQIKKVIENAGFKIIYSSYFNSILFFPAIFKRFIDKITGSDKKQTSPIDEVPDFINKLFTGIFNLELNWIPKMKVPFGLSIVIVAKKV